MDSFCQSKKNICLNLYKNISKSIFSNTCQTIEKIFSLAETQCSPFLCPYEGWVIFRKGELLAGRIGKNSIGSGNKFSIYSSLITLDSFNSTIECMLKNSFISSKWISDYGFSIGIDDVTSKSLFLYEKKKAFISWL